MFSNTMNRVHTLKMCAVQHNATISQDDWKDPGLHSGGRLFQAQRGDCWQGIGARMSTKTRPRRAGKETGLSGFYGYHDRGEETEENVDGGSY